MNDLIRRQDIHNHYPVLSHHILKRLAYLGEGPSYLIIGRNAYYRPDDITEYLNKIAVMPDLAERRKRKVVSDILAGSPNKRRPGRPKKQPTQPAA